MSHVAVVGRTLRVRRNRNKTQISFVWDCGEAGVLALPELARALLLEG